MSKYEHSWKETLENGKYEYHLRKNSIAELIKTIFKEEF